MKSRLAEKECKACQGGEAPLKGEALQALQGQLADGWETLQGHELRKTYTFKNFREALAFVNRVGEVAEAQQHHPDIYLAWGKVEVKVWTHKINGLTESDFIFAAKVDDLPDVGALKQMCCI